MVEIIISSVVTAIVTLGGFIGYYKPQKRLKEAEADEKNILNMQMIITSMQQEIIRLNKRLDNMQREAGERDAEANNYRSALSLLELKNTIKKNCILQAQTCKNSLVCPVLVMQQKYEAQYLKSLNHNVTEPINTEGA